MANPINAFWAVPARQLLGQLESGNNGLSPEEADRRLKRYGANRLNNKKQTGSLRLLLAQFKTPSS
ncbi:MAG: cation-transporting P-type ATPase [Methylobacter sp.]